ncbi:A/G-specific adenine glycosylase [Desulfatibacillum aliphaticivorans]|uniref:Adenine DNA glycosylase n=1 Tax=Desulfatibacillum aliphaticivorans TaxID=218208 RepID=B8FCI1_DESAL|nr:A/G-specific adenine glycosylase [Desulfatibacillum aliphaticivorans]ACL06144.1 A/G-specific adenine glycosylase [Desulfatibacillum aliphaticivorans]
MPETNAPKERPSKDFSRSLLRWYEENARDLPWRRTSDPYAIWVSEIMLQQTQVKTVIPYFLRWMDAFPNISSLAEAPLDDVLKMWEGLGYYSRARNMHKAAKEIMDRLDGRMPRTYKGLLELPGIGAYTAGAVCSIAYNQDVPLVDANVKRVFARILDMEKPVEQTAATREIRGLAESLIPSGKAGLFNQALMELGALVCTPKNPDCKGCPVSVHCLALKEQTVDSRPVLPPKKKTQALEVSAGVCVRDRKILIQKRLPKGLMAGLWEFPGGKLNPGESPEQALVREFAEELEIDIECGEKITVIQHAYTRFRVRLHVFWCSMKKPAQTPALHAAEEIRWVSPKELDGLAFPSADRRLIQMLMKDGIPA